MSAAAIRERNKAGKRLARARARGDPTAGELERRYAALCRQCENDREAANLAWLLGDEERHPERHARATSALLAAYGEGKSPRAARERMVAAISQDFHVPTMWDGLATATATAINGATWSVDSTPATVGQGTWSADPSRVDDGDVEPWSQEMYVGYTLNDVADPRGQELLYAAMATPQSPEFQ